LPEQILQVCQKIVDENFSRRAIEALVKSTEPSERQPRKAAVVSRAIKSGNVQVGTFRTYATGEMEFKLSANQNIPHESIMAMTDLLSIATDILSEGKTDVVGELSARLAERGKG
jgi:ParB family chromosome partitioning protein